MLNRLQINDDLYQYVFDVSVKETDVLKRLREETGKLPLAEMQIPAEQGQFLGFLVQALRARKVLEVGVFTGYSTLWMAGGLPDEGRIVACDISREWTDIARRHWQEAGVSDQIDLRIGPAIDTLAGLIGQGHADSFDFAFIDADKENYLAYYEHCVTLVRPGGVIAIDNVLRSGEVIDPSVTEAGTVQIRWLNERIRDDQRVLSCLLPMADGLTLAMKRIS
ncbi:O-methyltransferase (plasmid) [Azospirillum sp. B510]|uniref:O-methyltransferase n=1 Tax=Azospirillum sp. (strain B510) TaxID=137722 RepID=UPI0001C4CF5D|nr:class I SAM-dependent methyltransferase [Azospirillum sp. B510]BAI76831.1 O-methyltransferase [Azospirillum sp. B510]